MSSEETTVKGDSIHVGDIDKSQAVAIGAGAKAIVINWQQESDLPDLETANQIFAQLPTEQIPPVATIPAWSRTPFPPNDHFVGRAKELRQLATQLKGGETIAVGQTTAGGQTTATTGYGGIGKSQLASAFVHRYGAYFAGGVFWINCGEPSAIPIQVAECGGSKHLQLRPDFDQLDLDSQVGMVERAWAAPIPRLLVLDNCEAEDVLKAWRPTSGGCRVLVTSRRGRWSAGLGVQQLPLDVLERAESIALLQELAKRLSEAEADGIAGELGDFPLALHLAGSYLHSYPMVGVADYLTQLQQTGLLAHQSLQGRGATHSPTEHERHVGRTFALSYQQLQPDNPIDQMAKALLIRAAHFAPNEPIPSQLLQMSIAEMQERIDNSITKEDEPVALAVADGLHRLLGLGLLMGDAHQAGVQTHRLVGAYAQAQAEDEGALADVEWAIIKEATRLNKAGYPLAWGVMQSHLSHATQQAMGRADERSATLCNELGYLLQDQGAYEGATPYYKRALGIVEQVLGANHPYTAISLNNLGLLLKAQGAYERALPYLERALGIYEQVLGANHPHTASSLNNLGLLLKEQGAYADALPYLERALGIFEQVLGANHPDTAQSLNNLGSLLQAQGAYEEALTTYERALGIVEQALGANHPDTAISLNNLGLLLQAQGAYEDALPYLERALTIWEQVLGADHPDTASSLNNLGGLLYEQGAYERALPYLERALGIYEQVLGANHPHTASSLNNLGLLLQAQGAYEGALPYLERALAITEQTLGANHPHTALSLNNLGMLLKAQGAYEEATPYLERALGIWEQVLGANHPDTALSLNNLGMLLKAQGAYEEATPYLERALAIFEQVLGANHPHTQTVRKNMQAVVGLSQKPD